MENILVVARDSKGKDRSRCKVRVFIYSRGIHTYMCKRHISGDGSLVSWLWWWMHKTKQVINYMVPSISPSYTYTNEQVKLTGEVWIRLVHCITINKLVLIYYNFANISIRGKWVLCRQFLITLFLAAVCGSTVISINILIKSIKNWKVIACKL